MDKRTIELAKAAKEYLSQKSHYKMVEAVQALIARAKMLIYLIENKLAA